MSDYRLTRDAAGKFTRQYDKMLRKLDDDDLVESARLAQHDERMATGALYGDLADRIEELEAERDALAEQLAATKEKLAKLVYLQSGGPCTGMQSEQWLSEARATFAQITRGKTDE